MDLLVGGRTDDAIRYADDRFGPDWRASAATAPDWGVTRAGPNWSGVIVGLVVAGIALMISLGSMSSAQQGGGQYVIFWGAVLWGGYKALRSLAG